MVSQMRNAIRFDISLNPKNVGYIYGNGVKYETVRISHQNASVPANQTNPVGLGTSYSYFLEAEYDSTITKDTILMNNGIAYKTGPIDEIGLHGEIYVKRSPLTIVAPSTTNQITSFKIGTIAGSINNTANTIIVTLPTGTIVTSLTPAITHNGKLIDKIGTQDFTIPVEYTITAENLTTKKYIVTVVLA